MDDVKPEAISCSDVRAELSRELVTIASRIAFEFNGSRDTCILTSFALNDVLQRLGYSSRPLRVEAAVFPDAPKAVGTILGWTNPPGRRRAAKPDHWWGHLAVLVDEMWLLDATLDQANKQEWPRSMRVGPLAVRLSENFWAERGSILVQVNQMQRPVFSTSKAKRLCPRRRRPAIALATPCRSDFSSTQTGGFSPHELRTLLYLRSRRRPI